ncbi:unnamed protein product [Prunus armeniaca]|uniref:Uncharacterized protein n=1 Tax=Prunus armeniaca TaxID=36596 RepID=A0A6J5VDI6_PRUAR|nr:unnamed protein product [Prunus armeniaca]CAB4315810.1 unnamed protein product [Prunus armeniaca]
MYSIYIPTSPQEIESSKNLNFGLLKQKHRKKIMIMPLREIDEHKNSTEAVAVEEPCMSREADLHHQLPWKWN